MARALGRQAVDDLRALQQVERELERQGYLTRKGGELELTAKAIRRIGQTALRRVFASLEGGTRGDHDVRDAGAAGELTGTTREWRFGDEQPLDVVKTVSNAVRRRMVDRDGPLLRPEDFEIRETERRTRAAVALLVDQSFSMVMNDTWRTAKTTAMALHALATTQFPLDAVEIIAFANLARRIKPHELPDLDANDIQGTNLQHALMLAGRFLDKHPDAEPVVLVVTDGEPTAHLDRDGEWWFSWPPRPGDDRAHPRRGRQDDASRRAAVVLPPRRRPAARAVPRRHRATQRRPGAGTRGRPARRLRRQRLPQAPPGPPPLRLRRRRTTAARREHRPRGERMHDVTDRAGAA